MNKNWMTEDNFAEFEASSDRREARRFAKDIQFADLFVCNGKIKKEIGYFTKQNIDNPHLKKIRAEHFNDPIMDDTVP